ncbi:hypothetical protein [Herbaspirillum robiniae]|uniref:hypothetical protein n=1 Tax=Herbaspirillum robiniae TaxID=2014887 RepID=UPI003D783971
MLPRPRLNGGAASAGSRKMRIPARGAYPWLLSLLACGWHFAALLLAPAMPLCGGAKSGSMLALLALAGLHAVAVPVAACSPAWLARMLPAGKSGRPALPQRKYESAPSSGQP